MEKEQREAHHTTVAARWPGDYIEIVDARCSTETAPGGPYLVINGRVTRTTKTCVHLHTGEVYEIPTDWKAIMLSPGVRRQLHNRRRGEWLLPGQWDPVTGLLDDED
jgi:hypothetical protein